MQHVQDWVSIRFTSMMRRSRVRLSQQQAERDEEATMVGLLTFATLILLRLGLPLAATALMVWLLQQLDARWQAEAERQQRATPRVVARVPCWEIRQCPPESRATCPAYAQPDLPC